ncbi:lysozyme inhibitor LprI family protein [Achromobacter spanius]|uniref:lysozyme inhibitor LprI family protein n=1 Tax=Achromobacter spanius TaxID=217203 RepID=UPI0038212779
MRAVNALVLCVVSITALVAANAAESQVSNEREMLEMCSAYSQAGMRDCLADKADDSQQVLQAAEKAAAAALARWDEDRKYQDEAAKQLAASNQEFARYRTAQCAFSMSLIGGGAGNSREIGRLRCVAALNYQRASQLRDAVADLPFK